MQLSPTRTAKLSFTVQLILTVFWLAWVIALLLSSNPESSQSFMHYIFLGLGLAFLVYIILQNTSVFGVQSYIEVTPQYIVQKFGVFRKKQVIPIPEIEQVYISPLALRVTRKDGAKVYLDLKQVRKKRDMEKIKAKVRHMAPEHGYVVTNATNQRS